MKTKLRLGIIGAGAVVREIYQHLYFHSHYSHLLDIRAVADPNEQSRNWFAGLAGLPPDRRFADYRDLLARVELDAVQVNTPDHLHCAPTVDALKAGLDVVVPKPTAATVKDAHAMIQAAKNSGRFLGIDFHKREDPRIKEAEARFQNWPLRHLPDCRLLHARQAGRGRPQPLPALLRLPGLRREEYARLVPHRAHG